MEVGDLYELEDEDNEKVGCVVVDIIEDDGNKYAVLQPEDDDDSLMVFKVNGESEDDTEFEEIDEDTADKIFKMFLDRLDAEDEESEE